MRARDPRRWIHGGLAALFALAYAAGIAALLPTRDLSAAIHLWALPVAAGALAAGMLAGGRLGYRLALGGASLQLLAAILLVARLLLSAAFLAGVYGDFGTAAASGALVAVALVIELVGILPVVALRYLRSPAGRRAFGAA